MLNTTQTRISEKVVKASIIHEVHCLNWRHFHNMQPCCRYTLR